jgi:hypothetical protein
VEPSLFADAADAALGMVPRELGPLFQRSHRYGVKLWFGTEAPAREHYEAQVVGAKHVADARTLAIEIGFHAEHARQAENDEVLARLLAGERRWRRALGPAAVAGAFLGRDGWCRVSETWADPDLGEPGLAFAIAARLVDYVTVLEPARRA